MEETSELVPGSVVVSGLLLLLLLFGTEEGLLLLVFGVLLGLVVLLETGGAVCFNAGSL